MTHRFFRNIACFSAFFVLAAVGSAEIIVEEGVSKPSKDRTISFIRPGLVEKVFVKDDDVVTAEQLLAKLDDAAERIQLEQLKATAEDTTEIEAEEAQLNHAQIELQLKEDAHKKNVAPMLEVLQAETQVKIAKARVKIAKFKRRMNKLKYEEAKLQLERMELKSPIDGIVDEIAVDEGEAVDSQMRPVMRIISIDPMWIDVNVPNRQARNHLRKGQSAEIKFVGVDQPKTGKIIKVASDADPASETVRVRVELPNPEKRGTGETVTVTFIPDSNGPAAAVGNTTPATDKPNEAAPLPK